MTHAEITELLNSGLINKSELARRMYPGMGDKTAKNYLNNKLHNRQRQSLNAEDRKLISEIFKELNL